MDVVRPSSWTMEKGHLPWSDFIVHEMHIAGLADDKNASAHYLHFYKNIMYDATNERVTNYICGQV